MGKLKRLLNPDKSIENPVNSKASNIVLDKWLINSTQLNIPQNIKHILSLGEKFNIPLHHSSVPYERIICDVESAIYNVEDKNTKTEIRNNFCNILTNFKHSNVHKKLLTQEELVFLKDFDETKKFLREHKDVLVTRADKGNVTVIIDRVEYDNKINKLLGEKSYIPITKPTTTAIQRNLNSMITEWQRENRISKEEGKKLRSYNGVPARVYGLPKVHKSGIPLRPIVSSIGTTLYSLSSFLSDVLNQFVGRSPTFVRNAEDLRAKLGDVIIPEDHLLVSFDVVSLFTNVDSNLVLALVKIHWRDIKKNSGIKLTQKQFLEALSLVLNNCEFSFRNQFFKQVFGSPMGSPVSPAVANLVMEYIENQVLKRSKVKPLFFYRYVDDIITAIPRDEVEMLLADLNNFDENIQFTVEREKDRKLPFLDLVLCRKSDGKISTDWYHKETWSGRYLHFSSWLPMSYKRNTISLLTRKILQLSDEEFHKRNFDCLRKTLVNNGYPQKFVNHTIKNTRNKLRFSVSRSPLVVDVDPKNIISYASVPYVKHLYEKVKKLLSNYDIQVVGRASASLGSTIFSNLKDRVEKGLQKDVIYQVTCDCEATYTGQTKQNLKTRIYQHSHDGRNLSGVQNTPDGKSALSVHLQENNHEISMDNVKILDKEPNYRKRSILEMIHIKQSVNSINKQTDTEYLQNTYDNLIRSKHRTVLPRTLRQV